MMDQNHHQHAWSVDRSRLDHPRIIISMPELCIAGELNNTTNCWRLRCKAKDTSHRIFHQARNKGQTGRGRTGANRIILGTRLLIILTAKQSFIVHIPRRAIVQRSGVLKVQGNAEQLVNDTSDCRRFQLPTIHAQEAFLLSSSNSMYVSHGAP